MNVFDIVSVATANRNRKNSGNCERQLRKAIAKRKQGDSKGIPLLRFVLKREKKDVQSEF